MRRAAICVFERRRNEAGARRPLAEQDRPHHRVSIEGERAGPAECRAGAAQMRDLAHERSPVGVYALRELLEVWNNLIDADV